MADDTARTCEELHDPISVPHLHLFGSDGSYAHSISKAGLQPIPLSSTKKPLE